MSNVVILALKRIIEITNTAWLGTVCVEGSFLYYAERRTPACALPLSSIPSSFWFSERIFIGLATAAEHVAEAS